MCTRVKRHRWWLRSSSSVVRSCGLRQGSAASGAASGFGFRQWESCWPQRTGSVSIHSSYLPVKCGAGLPGLSGGRSPGEQGSAGAEASLHLDLGWWLSHEVRTPHKGLIQLPGPGCTGGGGGGSLALLLCFQTIPPARGAAPDLSWVPITSWSSFLAQHSTPSSHPTSLALLVWEKPWGTLDNSPAAVWSQPCRRGGPYGTTPAPPTPKVLVTL